VRSPRAALDDTERGYGNLTVDIHPEALDHLVNVSNGDARSLLNALELAVETTPPGENGDHRGRYKRRRGVDPAAGRAL
jgi:replication-associated recombination protein RarA